MNEEYLEEIKENFICIKINNEEYLYIFGPVRFPMKITIEEEKIVEFDWYVWKGGSKPLIMEEFFEIYKEDNGVNCDSVLVYGDINKENFLVRIHSGCITGDVFHSVKCDCGFQLNESIRQIVKNEAGMIVYVSSHEGRGIGLFAKAICSKLQENGLNTYEANNCLGFDDDQRNFDEVAAIVKYLRHINSIILLSNNSLKSNWMRDRGIVIKEVRPLSVKPNNENLPYLRAKKLRGENIYGIL